MAQPLRTTEECLRRADRHARVADALADAGDEWAAVCYFYSAYHLARAALMVNPVFSDVDALQALHRNLIPDDRTVSRHKGRRRPGQPPELGVNDVLRYVYPAVSADYENLHAASNDVRYHLGLPSSRTGEGPSPLTRIREAHERVALSLRAEIHAHS